MHRLQPVALLLMAAACTEQTSAFDPFPIRFDLSRGGAVLAIDVGDGPVPAIIDTATPLTVIDPFEVGQPAPAARRRSVTVTLVGLDDDGQPKVPRAQFPNTPALELHPCQAEALCRMGMGDDAIEFRGIVGADTLSRTAARFDFAAGELRFFPDTAGTSAQLTDDCLAVIGRAFAGGGTLAVGGTEIIYGSFRPVVGACMGAEGTSPVEEGGSDALVMLSTGLGTSVLAATAYERYAAAAGAPALDSLPVGRIYFPSGPAEVRLGQVGRLALVGSLGSGTADEVERGPCRELSLNRLESEEMCDGNASCPCTDPSGFCPAAAAVDLERPIDVAILDDGDPLLQALRDELRPETPELDGILGTAALTSLRLELDYVNDRMIMRCLEGPCITLPAIRSRPALATVQSCQALEAMQPDAGPAADGGT